MNARALTRTLALLVISLCFLYTPSMSQIGGGGTIQAESQALDRMFFEANQRLAGERGRSGRRDGDSDAKRVGFVDQFVQVSARERIASRQNQLRQRIAELPDLAQKYDAFIEGEFHGMGIRRGFRAAVTACQSACLGYFPINIDRSPRVIPGRVMKGSMHSISLPSRLRQNVWIAQSWI